MGESEADSEVVQKAEKRALENGSVANEPC